MVKLEDMVVTDEELRQDKQLQRYITNFSKRYSTEDRFQEMVHKHLEVTGFENFRLKIGKVIFRNWYKDKTDNMIVKYATEIRRRTLRYEKLQDEIKKMREAGEVLRQEELKKRRAEEAKRRAEEHYLAASKLEKGQRGKVEGQYMNHVDVVTTRSKKQEDELRRVTDAREIAKQQLTEFVTRSSLVQNKGGELSFNEDALVQRLEEIFLLL